MRINTLVAWDDNRARPNRAHGLRELTGPGPQRTARTPQTDRADPNRAHGLHELILPAPTGPNTIAQGNALG